MTYTVRVTSEEYGSEDFHDDSMSEALDKLRAPTGPATT